MILLVFARIVLDAIEATQLDYGQRLQGRTVSPAYGRSLQRFGAEVWSTWGEPLGKVHVHAPEELILNKIACYRLSEFGSQPAKGSRSEMPLKTPG